ncbi:acetyl-CoA C-acyltransferase [Marinobacterium litorale]|uniref:acetyl-CoA C-acyltransferase n=1 Tax=Marinobacterium litorale TaxID=404770 RepID=UPI00040BB311|nr:acetyl-CoA C-acyltransferase [Marinobacterium litorale]
MKLKPNDAVIVDAGRSAMALSDGGGFRHLRADLLSAHLVDALLARNPAFDREAVDDLIWGCAHQAAAQGGNLARQLVVLSSLPSSIPGQTINRLGASSMSALQIAVQGIMSGCGESYIVGGVERQGHLPTADAAAALSLHTARASLNGSATAELLAHTHGIDRALQDRFAQRSHRNAARAHQDGAWEAEIIRIAGHDHRDFKVTVDADEAIIPDLSLEALRALQPVSESGVTVTRGNSAARCDGAAALLVVSGARAQALGLRPRARIRAVTVTACDPVVMGLGPVTAVEKLLDHAGLQLTDIDLFEINEVFASQSLAVLKELELLDRLEDDINVNGGAIALGDPLGCSGARICTTLLNLLERRDLQWGIATLCAGMGQGMAALFERLD